MDFFKSVFSEPTPDPSPTSPPTSTWGFGSTLLQSIASKSESLIDNYYKDLQEFSSGFKKETSVIREAASRAVQELPARLESGAAIAQESLEAVGQAIDNVGSTVSDIIGKDLNFASNDRLDQSDDHDNVGSSTASRDAELNFIANNAKPYSRIDAMIRALQCDIRTYIDEVEESGFSDWELGFRLEERRKEIEGLLDENSAIAEILGEVVPGNVDEEAFWCRYFYRVDKVVKMEEARLRMVKRAISSEGEEELSWDVDDDDDDCDNGGEYKLKDDELNNKDGEEEKGNKLKDDGSSTCLASPSSSIMLLKGSKIMMLDNEDGAGVSGGLVDDESLGERSLCHEKEEASEGKLGSDISIISSQRSSHGEDDLGWDEIEDIRSGDESNVGDAAVDVGKRVSGAEQDEELTWDIDEDDEPIRL
ncbi:hypothetical protein C2S51_021336 [Perilla frutescens var. frutescens]|nr:hypothetical protein C2S51_021336 [Perilla frutescens var. frutescens]